jgi:hypothetical protein
LAGTAFFFAGAFVTAAVVGVRGVVAAFCAPVDEDEPQPAAASARTAKDRIVYVRGRIMVCVFSWHWH